MRYILILCLFSTAAMAQSFTGCKTCLLPEETQAQHDSNLAWSLHQKANSKFIIKRHRIKALKFNKASVEEQKLFFGRK